MRQLNWRAMLGGAFVAAGVVLRAANPAAAAYDYSSVVLGDGPTAYWRLGEASGATSLVDASGLGHTATPTGGAWVHANGLIGGDTDGSGSLTGSNYARYVDSANSLNYTNSFTEEAWINANSSTYNAGIIEKGGNGACGFLLRIAANKLTAFIGNGGWTSIADSANLTYGVIHHVVSTFDGTTFRLYKDGAQVASTTSAKPCSSAGVDVLLGHDIGANVLVGQLDEAAIYPTALSAAQVSAHYANGIDGTTGPAPTTTTTAPAPTTTTSTTAAPTTTSTTADPGTTTTTVAGGGGGTGGTTTTTDPSAGGTSNGSYTPWTGAGGAIDSDGLFACGAIVGLTCGVLTGTHLFSGKLG